MWEVIGNASPLFAQKWPMWDEDCLKADSITIVIQINGKVRENISVPADADKDGILEAARAAAKHRFLTDTPKKEIYVPGKLVNFVF